MGQLLSILAVIGFIVWIALKLFPIYIEQGKITTALENLKIQPEIGSSSPAELKKTFLRRLAVDTERISDKNYDEIVKVEKTSGGFKMTVYFEDSTPLVKNLHLKVVFDKTIEVP